MECAVITTYRCNARCKMCDIWRYPTKPEEEFDPEILHKIPKGMKRLNITGGEPTLRNDLIKIVEILNEKTKRLELVTNGSFPKRIIEVAKNFPNISIRISIEGFPKLNEMQRGLKNGFENALKTILELKDLGLKDIGFAIVISDKNIQDLKYLNLLSQYLEVEFSQSTLHNSFYFHKKDNKINNISFLETRMNDFIKDLLTSRRKNIKLRVKDWFRAYINAGLLKYMRGENRSLPCYAGSESFFLDPWGKVLACNGSPDPWVMGDLNTQNFYDIWNSKQSDLVRGQVKNCKENCWMAGTSVPAMRNNILIPVKWVIKNKIALIAGREINEKI